MARGYHGGMPSDPDYPATVLLGLAANGDHHAVEQLIPLVYGQLRATANRLLAQESPGHTLQPTALVNEAYLKLVGPREVPWAGRAHFYAAAAQAMRRILVDHARAKAARGGRQGPVAALPDIAALAAAAPRQILAVDRALTRLEAEDPDAAGLVRLRFFAGLSVEQAAEALGVSPRSAARLWTFARARLHRMLTEGE